MCIMTERGNVSKFLSIINNLFRNLCEIVAWRNFVIFGILLSGEAMMHHRKMNNKTC